MSQALSDQLPIPGLDVQLTTARPVEGPQQAATTRTSVRRTVSVPVSIRRYTIFSPGDALYVSAQLALDADSPSIMITQGRLLMEYELLSEDSSANPATPSLVGGVTTEQRSSVR